MPKKVEFATKPALAKEMIERVLDAGAPAAWVAGDEVYGADPALRTALAARGLGFVLAVAKSHHFTTGIGSRRAIDLAVRLPPTVWQRRSAGPGVKGQRWYHWALVEASDPALSGSDATTGDATDGPTAAGTRGVTGLLIRRNVRTGEYAFYRIYAPRPVPLAELIRVAGTRWKIEESFAAAKELTALDEHQVRTWTSWHRWTLLAMLAHAFLTVLTVRAAPRTVPPKHATASPHDAPATLIPLTRNEIRRLLSGAWRLARDAHHQLQWSTWRRHHQAVAQTSHYKRREEATT